MIFNCLHNDQDPSAANSCSCLSVLLGIFISDVTRQFCAPVRHAVLNYWLNVNAGKCGIVLGL